MPPNRLVLDGLWRCLCPSYDRIPSSRLLSINATRPPAVAHHRHTAKPIKKVLKARHQHNSARPINVEGENGLVNANNAKDASAVSGRLPRDQIKKRLHEASGEELHEELRKLRLETRSAQNIFSLVDHLLNVRKENPAALHYESLLRANADALHGSALAVASLLSRAKEDGVVSDSGIFHSALHALATHPDYLLRNEILQNMRDHWYTLSMEGQHDLLISLLREDQYELALDRLDNMLEQGLTIEPWLYDIMIYVFCEGRDIEDAFGLLKRRVEAGVFDIPPYIWYYMLDHFSSQYFYEGTRYVWQMRAANEYLNPSDGMCLNVLNTAARHSDPNLATDVIRVLSARGSKVGVNHYEALSDAYCGIGELQTAIRVLCIMHKAGLAPSMGSTRALSKLLATNYELPSQAYDFLLKLKSTERIPIAAINVVIEAFVTQGNLREALKCFKDISFITGALPTTETFNTLFKGCKLPGHKKTALFLAGEMASLNVKADPLTYDRLILVCLEESESDIQDAFLYLEEMKAVFGPKGPRAGTWAALVKRCVALGDPRAQDLIQDMAALGMSVSKLEETVKQNAVKDHHKKRAMPEAVNT